MINVQNKKNILAGVVTKPSDPLEKDIQKAICTALSAAGYLFWRSNNATSYKGKATNKAFTPDGIPDITIIHKGMFIGLEVKRPHAALRPSQVVMRDRIGLNGGYYYVVTSAKDLEAIPELL